MSNIFKIIILSILLSVITTVTWATHEPGHPNVPRKTWTTSPATGTHNSEKEALEAAQAYEPYFPGGVPIYSIVNDRIEPPRNGINSYTTTYTYRGPILDLVLNHNYMVIGLQGGFETRAEME